MRLELAPYGTSNYTDVTDTIKHEGIKWSLNSVDADGAGRTLDGNMQRKLIGEKNKFEIQCVPLTADQRETYAELLSNEWLSVRLTTNTGTYTYRMYPGATVSAAILKSWDGWELWGGFAYSLIER